MGTLANKIFNEWSLDCTCVHTCIVSRGGCKRKDKGPSNFATTRQVSQLDDIVQSFNFARSYLNSSKNLHILLTHVYKTFYYDKFMLFSVRSEGTVLKPLVETLVIQAG